MALELVESAEARMKGSEAELEIEPQAENRQTSGDNNLSNSGGGRAGSDGHSLCCGRTQQHGINLKC